jgi:hypothetical protein
MIFIYLTSFDNYQVVIVIGWKGGKIVDREGHRKTRWIKEAVAIRRAGMHVMNS